jgi:hypothetical protein
LRWGRARKWFLIFASPFAIGWRHLAIKNAVRPDAKESQDRYLPVKNPAAAIVVEVLTVLSAPHARFPLALGPFVFARAEETGTLSNADPQEKLSAIEKMV